MNNEKSSGSKTLAIVAAIAVTVFGYWYFESESDREQAQLNQAISIVTADADKYLDESIFRDYVAENIDDLIIDYGLYTEYDMGSLYNDAQKAKEEAYIDGWQECCVYYGIDDEVYYTDEELSPTSDEGLDATSYDPYKNQFAGARARADASAKKMREIYVAPTGARYHFSKSCAGENAILSAIEEAENQGYTPCQKCTY